MVQSLKTGGSDLRIDEARLAAVQAVAEPRFALERKVYRPAHVGGGFVEFYWVKPGETGEHPKLGYVEPIPNTNYFIGSGVYLAE
jgi:hypothetical protein